MTYHLHDFSSSAPLPDLGATAMPRGADHICILLGLCNGAATLGEQLRSLAGQSHRDWSLILSDDGSRDDWLPVMSDFGTREAPGRTFVTRGPGRGYAANFLHLLCVAGPMTPYAAFCDQDDVWLPNKLARALAHLKTVPDSTPAIYVSRTMICDEKLENRRPSLLFRKPPGFGNALVQNIGGGNTMVMNRAALDLLQDTAPRAAGIVAHDWWVYQLITGAGGRVLYDAHTTLLYRQHGGNMIGANDSLLAQALRIKHLLQGQFRDWNSRNLAALDRVRPWLTDEAIDTVDRFQAARRGRLPSRLLALKRAGVWRQRRRGGCALWLAALANRL
ncbi:MAG: glycosyltransferase [Silicimonas sp.]|nr:glycosyltransferase [Silicimonas sp.]